MNVAAQCDDLESLSQFLGFAPQHIYYLVEDPDRFYISIEVPKRSNAGSKRAIDIPSSELKGVQRAILKKILNHFEVDECVHSYVTSRSVITAAKELCPGRAVLKLDIADFFPSITFQRIFGLFKAKQFSDASSYILSRLTTYNGCLPQGAPSSPTISNVIMANFDLRLANLAKAWQLKYLRYSDDIYLHKDKNFNHPRLTEIVEQIVVNSGFNVNETKTKYYPRGVPRVTLGLLTHGVRPKIPGPQRRIYRAAFFKASRNIHWGYHNLSQLTGMLEWHKCVNGRDAAYFYYKEALDNINRLQLHDTYRSQ